MSENLELYRRAMGGFDNVIRQVPDDKWEAQSPCIEWKAIDVAGHVIGVQKYLTQGLADAPPAGASGDAAGEAPSLREQAGDDPVASWAAARAALETAAAEPGALDRLMKTPFGEMPVDSFLGIILLDALTHTWDLARASGVDDSLDDELVTVAFERIRPLDAAIRGGTFFGPAIEPPADADEQTQLMAFLGRQV